jgi:quercetin dioxygenase-like cupin family protein
MIARIPDTEEVDLLNVRRVGVAAVAVVALAAAWLGGAISAGGATPAPTATRAMLAGIKNPVGAKGRTLGLSMVTIPTGVALPLHHHEGTQVAYVQRGVLLYSVRSGSVRVMRGLADQSPKLVRTIGAGQTGAINAGQWIVEQPSTIHSAKAKVRVVVWLATLLRNGAPPATPVK